MKSKRNIVYLAGFLFSIPFALTSYINSSFLATFMRDDYVGLVYIVAATVTILCLLQLPRILARLGNRRNTLLFSLLNFFSFIVLAHADRAAVAIAAFIVNFISINFIIASLDIFIEDFSKNSSIGKFRGLYLVVINSAWVIAQAISGAIIAESSFAGIYLLSAFFMFFVCSIFIFSMHDWKDPEYVKIPVSKTIKTFFANSNLSKIYAVNLILKLFYAWMIIYTPIYLHQYLGFGWSQIGVIFTIMLLPFVLFEFPLGELSDRMGEKNFLVAGFVICTASTMLIPLLSSSSLWFWAMLLFVTRIGAATIEVMSESYFFKSVTERNDDEISFFRNTNPLSFLIAPLIAVPALFVVPSFRYLFFVLGVILLIGLFITLRLRDVIKAK